MASARRVGVRRLAAWRAAQPGSLLTLSKVISSYSISPSVPFTCNSSTGRKHRHSETGIPT